MGLNFEGEEGDYSFTHKLDGVKHFGLWPLSEAAERLFRYPRVARRAFRSRRPASSSRSLMSPRPPPSSAAKGYRLLHDARTEPWAQITARLLSPEGLLVAVCYTPSFHDGSDRHT